MDISVVVPTFKRDQLLERCVFALLEQTLASDQYEILVVDDGHQLRTRRLIERLKRTFPCHNLHYMTHTKHGPAAARNAGWRAAKGRIIAFTDDDCIPDRDWLREGQAAFTSGISAVSGQLIVPMREPASDYEHCVSWLSHAEFVTANCFYLRADLAEVGGFDEEFRIAWREDSDLFFSFIEKGKTCIRSPRPVVTHPIRKAPWGVSILEQKKSFFNPLLYKKHPDLYRQKVEDRPPLLYYVMLILLAGGLMSFIVGSSLTGWFLGAWAVCALYFTWIRLRPTRKDVGHILEMAVTSMVIPVSAIYWRVRGALHFKVLYL